MAKKRKAKKATVKAKKAAVKAKKPVKRKAARRAKMNRSYLTQVVKRLGLR